MCQFFKLYSWGLAVPRSGIQRRSPILVKQRPSHSRHIICYLQGAHLQEAEWEVASDRDAPTPALIPATDSLNKGKNSNWLSGYAQERTGG